MRGRGVDARRARPPGPDGGDAAPFTERTPRVAAARKLHRRPGRVAAGRFLVEGAQAVREAVAAGVVRELFATPDAAARHTAIVDAAAARAVRLSLVTAKAAESLAETVTTQGLFAVCDVLDVPLATVLGARGDGADKADRALRADRSTGAADVATGARGGPRLVAVLAGVAEPGNAGAVVRVADAAGADAVVLAGDAVDPHNGKCVRASAGSVFHVPLAIERDPHAVLAAARAAGLRVLATTAAGDRDLDDAADDGTLAAPTAWLFGSEAHGLDDDLLAAADDAVRVPIHGRAESLNLATAAAVCLYASARAQRRA